MSTVVVLSSSPPRTFARSPTPADSSPSLPSLSQIFKHGSQSPKRFKSSATPRHGFSGGFSSARSMLVTKKGAENIPFKSPNRDKSKPVNIFLQSSKSKFSMQPLAQNAKLERLGPHPESQKDADLISNKSPIPSAAPDIPGGKFQSSDPVLLETAIPRRMDWTPLKSKVQEAMSEPQDLRDESATVPRDLMASFGLTDLPEPEKRVQKVTEGLYKPVKRTKVELTEGHPGLNPLKDAARKIESQIKSVPKKQTKSPAKKPVTITHFATSHYFGNETRDGASPMMQFLTSTQARSLDIADLDQIEMLSNVPRKRAKKSTRSIPSKLKLLSPKSAIQKLNDQDAIFGSASQLIREEHHVVLSDPKSDPVSPQRTQAISIASGTPQTERGTARFKRTRGLWAAAGRDEDNALLHVESVDLCDTPSLRAAFAGKDALVAPAQGSDKSREQMLPVATVPLSMAGPLSPSNRRPSILDIDDFSSPPAQPGQSARALHTARTEETSILANPSAEVGVDESQNRKRVSAAKTKPKGGIPREPSYAGLDTSILQKQLKTYGFKPVKKREKMIELLEKCWEAKHGKQKASPELEDDFLKHGDFLSKVHDISSRPEPKVKKPRKRTKAEANGTSPVKPTKRRKKAVSTAQEEVEQPKVRKPRQSRSKKAKASEVLVDLHDVSIETVTPQLGNVTDNDVGVSTPPPALPPTAHDRISAPVSTAAAQESTSAKPTGQDMGNRIQAAILRQSEISANNGRDHVRNPTWHEKILMYDPIILEDLTSWLNTQGLNQINEDCEVSAFDVREWCESKGICCLWKGGWRGQKSKATED